MPKSKEVTSKRIIFFQLFLWVLAGIFIAFLNYEVLTGNYKIDDGLGWLNAVTGFFDIGIMLLLIFVGVLDVFYVMLFAHWIFFGRKKQYKNQNFIELP